MGTAAVPRPARLSWEGPKLRPLSILMVVAIGIAIVAISFALGWAILAPFGDRLLKRLWPLIILAELFELTFALIGISIARRRLPNADFGLRWPRGKARIGRAIAWGAAFAAIMFLSDHGIGLLHGRTPETTGTTAFDIAGWLAFNLLQVGLCEEVLFRGFLLGLLEALSPSRVRFGAFSMSTAGIIIALFFALAHAENFATEAWPLALGQQVYAFGFGLLYAWWRERSGSLLTPVIVHSLSDFLEEAVTYILAGFLPH